ncbi:hypothetical protein GCM10009765_56350 [Fodinicola feengrottensis]|uniref:Uncharacterized protein n=1 Tax=Fodinicola feengrottensis TaxID=435914 RepID=A0ABP4U5S5_9ACTN
MAAATGAVQGSDGRLAPDMLENVHDCIHGSQLLAAGSVLSAASKAGFGAGGGGFGTSRASGVACVTFVTYDDRGVRREIVVGVCFSFPLPLNGRGVG